MLPFFSVSGQTSTEAVRASEFLNSIGTQSAISVRGEKVDKTIECCRYLGVRWLRAGIECDVPVEQYVSIHNQTGIRFSWGLGSGGTNLTKLIATARPLAEKGALLAFEGPNEPNNWPITYGGKKSGQENGWTPIAQLQRDLYRSVKSDPILKSYPVWSISEPGAEPDNVGLQFMTIPAGANTVMPAGTRYADFANLHNYLYHPNSPNPADNKTWDAADPSPACRVDGLYGENGVTWANHYPGYSQAELLRLPRVTTETGCQVGGDVTEEMHGRNLLSMFLDQFKRGWSYSSVYLLRDRVDEAGNQKFGFYRPDYTPRPAAVYLHNLTTILSDSGVPAKTANLAYTIEGEPATMHDLLLEKSDRSFYLVVWNERLSGSDAVNVTWSGPKRHVQFFDPTIGTIPLQRGGYENGVSLRLGDHPEIIELSPE